MFLTKTYEVVDVKNDDRGRRECVTRLSRRTQLRLAEISRLFTIAWARVVAWGRTHDTEIAYEYEIKDKEGKLVFKRDGTPRMGKYDAHALANWLFSRVGLSDLGLTSARANAARTQAAETLLSQHELRKMAAVDPRRLTSAAVGEVNTTMASAAELNQRYADALGVVENPESTPEQVRAAAAVLAAPTAPKYLPITFASPDDFVVFRHRENGRLFVAIQTLSKGGVLSEPTARKRYDKKRGQWVAVDIRAENKLDPLPPWAGRVFARLEKHGWVLLPLRRVWKDPLGRDGLKRSWEQRYAPDALDTSGTRPFEELDWEEIFADPRTRTTEKRVKGQVQKKTVPWVNPRSAELACRDGAWRFNIVVDVPEPEPYAFATFLGVHFGFYKVHWTLLNREGNIVREDSIDLSEMRTIVAQAAGQRAFARRRGRADKYPQYRGDLKRWRGKVVNWIIDVAVEHHAAVGVEDVAGLVKSTPRGDLNLFRSHLDYGKHVADLTYRAVLAGTPVVRRGVARTPSLFQTMPFGACSFCGASNKGKKRREKPVRYERTEEGVHVFCQACHTSHDPDVNAARVVASRTREFWLNRGRART